MKTQRALCRIYSLSLALGFCHTYKERFQWQATMRGRRINICSKKKHNGSENNVDNGMTQKAEGETAYSFNSPPSCGSARRPG